MKKELTIICLSTALIFLQNFYSNHTDQSDKAKPQQLEASSSKPPELKKLATKLAWGSREPAEQKLLLNKASQNKTHRL